MVICELCNKEFKNTQGLRGHMTFVHGQTGSAKILSAPAATEQRLSELEEGFELAELATDLLTEELASTDKRVKETDEQLSKLTEQLTALQGQLTQKLSLLNELEQPVSQEFLVVAQALSLLGAVVDSHTHSAQDGRILIDSDYLAKAWEPLHDFVEKELAGKKMLSWIEEMDRRMALSRLASRPHLMEDKQPKGKKVEETLAREEKEDAGENEPGFLAPLVAIFDKGKKE